MTPDLIHLIKTIDPRAAIDYRADMTLKTMTLSAALAALLLAPVQAAAPAPKLAIASFEDLPKPLPLPYDESADADAAVAAGKARARAGHKKLLIDLGGNWCLDCRILAGTMALPQLKAFVAKHFVVVVVDVGRMDKNQQIPRAYGIDKTEGVPAVLIVDPRTDTLLNAGRIFALSDARHMSPQALSDWLAQWA